MTKERFDERKSTQQQLNRETKVYLLLPFEKVNPTTSGNVAQQALSE
jgi:hypothetical protein